MDKLGIQSKKDTIRITRKIKGKWYKGGALPFSGTRMRYFGTGFNRQRDNGRVVPLIVDLGDNIQPISYEIPTLKRIQEYGFSIGLKVDPRIPQKNEILNIVYPNKDGKYIVPKEHFPLIMESIIQGTGANQLVILR